MTMEKSLSRKEASQYLAEKYGKPASISPNTLAKWQTIGGGPKVVHYGRKVGYLPSELDKWMLKRAQS